MRESLGEERKGDGARGRLGEREHRRGGEREMGGEGEVWEVY